MKRKITMAQITLTELALTTNDVCAFDSVFTGGFSVRLGAFQCSVFSHIIGNEKQSFLQLGWWGGNTFDISDDLADDIWSRLKWHRLNHVGDGAFSKACDLLREFASFLVDYAIQEEAWVWREYKGFGLLPVDLDNGHYDERWDIEDYTRPSRKYLLKAVESGVILTSVRY